MPWLACATNRSESPCPAEGFDSSHKGVSRAAATIKAALQRYWQEPVSCVEPSLNSPLAPGYAGPQQQSGRKVSGQFPFAASADSFETFE